MSTETLSQVQSGLFGGGGGNAFDDKDIAPYPIKKIVALAIRHGSIVDAIQATYLLENGSTWAAPKHGGDGGSQSDVLLQPNEAIVSFVIRSGSLVDNLTIVTELNGVFKEYGPFGGSGGGSGAVIGAIVSLYGRSGSKLDAIGVWGNPPLITSRATASAQELALEDEAVAKTLVGSGAY
jgi:hypothetical protein